MSAEELPAVTLALMNGKLDVIAERLAAIAKVGEDHEARVRLLEAKPAVDPKLEARLVDLEQRDCVTWRQFLAASGFLTAAVTAVTPFIVQLYGGHA